MDRLLSLHICSFLVPEVSKILKHGDYSDVVLKSFPSNCNSNSIDVSDFIPNEIDKSKYTKSIIFASNCLRNPYREENLPSSIEVVHMEQCQELIISKEIVSHYISKGYYVASSGWLKNYKQHILNWGFEGEMAKKFFKESMSKILLLDTGLEYDYMDDLKALSEYMGLEYEILPIGLSYCKNKIDAIVKNWRVEVERVSVNEKLSLAARESADYQVIINQLATLGNLTDEGLILSEISVLIDVLYAPQKVTHIKFVNGKRQEEKVFKTNEQFQKDKNNFFEIEISNKNEKLGIFEIFNVNFPQFIPQYRQMGKIISQVSGLAIANARKFALLDKQKVQLEEYSAQLDESNKSKDKFFSIIAHDLRGPMGTFLNLTELVSKNVQRMGADQLKTVTQSMSKSANSLFSLLENLLEWSRAKRGMIVFEPEEVSLKLLIDQSISPLLESAQNKNIEVSINNSEEYMVMASRNMGETIIRNLVSNAIKFTKPGGRISLHAKEIEGDRIEVSVEDTGIGIPPETIGKLFRIDSNVSTQGTEGELSSGLGLILSKEFVEKHGGVIYVESTLGKGSTFIFTLQSASSRQ